MYAMESINDMHLAQAVQITHPYNAAKGGLQNLIQQLAQPLLPLAVRNNSFLVNDIAPHLGVRGDRNTVAAVIDGILRSVINNTRESCIRIFAQELYGNLMEISVKDSNSFNTYAVACSLQDTVPLAQQIGGQLDIMNQRQRITTIVFRFPINHQTAGNPTESKFS
ncbi:MAG TPA: hypothetical protein VFI06_15700 [Chitinophagaceae bacterium]|nr:hypothetical protein [Chitinophagaceae bacterium]